MDDSSWPLNDPNKRQQHPVDECSRLRHVVRESQPQKRPDLNFGVYHRFPQQPPHGSLTVCDTAAPNSVPTKDRLGLLPPAK